MPTYHLASCADDADLRISHIIRGQDHLTNTFKHVLIFEARSAPRRPNSRICPLLIAPDGIEALRNAATVPSSASPPIATRTSSRTPSSISSCLLGWSPKDDREDDAPGTDRRVFSSKASIAATRTVNFTEEDPLDPKALWLNAEHIRALPVEDLTDALLPFVNAAGFPVDRDKMLRIAPLIQERIKLLRDVAHRRRFLFHRRVAALRQRRADPAERRRRHGAEGVANTAARCWLPPNSLTTAWTPALRAAAAELGIKTGQMFQPIRVAVCGRKNAPPLFATLEVLGRDTSLARIGQAIHKLQ